MSLRSAVIVTVILLASCNPESSLVRMPAYPTALELSAMMNAGETTSTEIVQEVLRRVNESESLNAFITVDSEGALDRAAELDRLRGRGEIMGPLHGVPLAVKDNIHVAGLPNTAGTPALNGFVPQSDNPVVAALKEAGAIVIGKTNMHELAFGITSNNAAFGAVANPFNTQLFAGGSSGGTASAIAAGLIPAGLGTDTGGSVRIPAALTGTVGFRPSSGRYPSSAVTPISSTRDTVGLIARTVEDLILLDEVIVPEEPASEQPRPQEIRLGVPRTYFYTNLDEESATVIESAFSQLADAGVVLIEADITDIEPLLANSAFPIALYEAARDLPAYLEEYNVGVSLHELAAAVASPDVQGIFSVLTGEGQISDETYAAALEAREALRKVYRDYFTTHDLDAVIFPTTLLPARPIENSLETVELNGSAVPAFSTYIHNTDPASIAALPGISLPVGLTATGLPVGIEIDGPEQSDLRLLRIAAVLERIFGFSARPPQSE
jgi:mandelamide amidase